MASFAQRVPLVLVNRFVTPQFSATTVHIDHEQAGYLAAQHLLVLGRRRLAYLGSAVEGQECSLASVGQYKGFRQGVEEAGLLWQDVLEYIHPNGLFDMEHGSV